jgi:hypothetical protein
MKKTSYLLITVTIIFSLNFECLVEKGPEIVPSDEYIVGYKEFPTTVGIEEYYLMSEIDYIFFYDDQNYIRKYGEKLSLYGNTNCIDKYTIFSDNSDLTNCSIMDMTRYQDKYLITVKCFKDVNYSFKFIETSNFDTVKIYSLVDLSSDISLIRGVKYYEKDDSFVGAQTVVIDGKRIIKILKFKYEITDDSFHLVEYVDGIINNFYYENEYSEITFPRFNVFYDSLWFYTYNGYYLYFDNYIKYYKIYEYSLIDLKMINEIEFTRKFTDIQDIVLFDGNFIWINNSFSTIRQFKKWH